MFVLQLEAQKLSALKTRVAQPLFLIGSTCPGLARSQIPTSFMKLEAL